MKTGIFVIALLLSLSACDQASAPSPQTAPPVAAESAPAPEPPATWNMADADGLTNGNLLLAAQMLMRGDALPQADASIAAAMKAPWNYYGKRVCFPAVTAHVDDMPPDSDLSKAFGGAAGEIVAAGEGENIIDMLVVGGTGEIGQGQRLNMCGLLVGKTEVPNAIGGTFTHLVMVGKLK